MIDASLSARFERHVDRSGSCWLWRGARQGSGYGVLHVDGKMVRAHRLSWELHNGQIPDGLLVLHRCDNPPCVRPDHLSIGTHQDNMADRSAKGRDPHPHRVRVKHMPRHESFANRPGVAERFWKKVERRGPTECWPWLAFTSRGYGRFDRSAGAHRVAYELAIGPIPDGFVIDHLCRNRSCVNPAHLQAVTAAANVLRGIGITAVNARKDRCKNGHLFDDANTFLTSKGRGCRICRRAYDRRKYALRRGFDELMSPDDPLRRTL